MAEFKAIQEELMEVNKRIIELIPMIQKVGIESLDRDISLGQALMATRKKLNEKENLPSECPR